MAMRTRYTTVEGEVLSQVSAGVRRDYVPDPLGSVVALLDSNQAKTDTFSYWPYGSVRTRTGTTRANFAFVGTLGYYTDSAARLYVRARYYSPGIAQWRTMDPLWPATRRPFLYVNGSPEVLTDASGLQGHPRTRKGRPKLHRVPWIGESGLALDFAYGAYCGSANVSNPGWRVLPQDCVDACCLNHDRCLEGNQGAGLTNDCAHRCCDTELANCVAPATATTLYNEFFGGGCCDDSEHPYWCRDAARAVEMAFEPLGGIVYRPSPRCKCIPRNQRGAYARRWWGNDRCQVPMEIKPK